MKRKFVHKKLILEFLEELTVSASASADDRVNVALDLLILTFECMPDDMLQKVLNQIAKEYKVDAPQILADDDLPF